MEAHVWKIDTGYHKAPDDYNGMIEVYPDFPWVYLDEEGQKRELINNAIFGYYKFNDNGEPEFFSLYGPYRFAYINPDHIVSIQESVVYDLESTEYYYSEITLDNGDVYFIADWWSAICERRDMQNE